MTKSHVIKLVLVIASSCVFTCTSDTNQVTPVENHSQQKVILVVIDGPRYSETWASQSRPYIPNLNRLSQEGIFFNNFFNDGVTYTLPGHTAITTGAREPVINNGSEFPSSPSLFQRYLKSTLKPPEKAWIITGKSKLFSLSDTKDLDWHTSYLPATDAEERSDEETLNRAVEIIDAHEPDIALIHFGDTDRAGHANDWNGYLKNIQKADQYVGELWNFIQNHPGYKQNTLLLITADHGRHLDGLSTGFVDHGDNCEGCRHIFLLALGSGPSEGQIIEKPYSQVDIAPTIAHILNFKWEGEGHVINELIKPKE